MTQQLTDHQAAEDSVLACAVFLAEKIDNSGGHDDAIEEIVPLYLLKNDVDTAAQLADLVESSFVRDRLLIEVADKCAENDDDEYALQLAEAIEENTSQDAARERIAIHKAQKLQFDKAFEIAESVAHNSRSLGEIALKLQENGEESRASETIAGVEDSSIKIYFLQEIALNCFNNENREAAASFLEASRDEAKNVDVKEEQIRTLQSIAQIYIEIGRKDKAIEVLAEAQNLAERLEGTHRNTLLSQISTGFLQAGSLELADRTLDLVNDKTIIAATLTHYAEDFYKKGEQAEAFEILEEARAILQSQHQKEVRSSQEKFSVLASIASQFALFDKLERAIEVALENPLESERFSALKKIAETAASKNRDDLARQAANEISEDSKKLEALTLVSDAYQNNEKTADALNILREVYSQVADVGQVSLRIDLLNQLAWRFHHLGDEPTARQIAHENIANISRIFDESSKAIALAHLGGIYERLGFSLNQEEKDSLLALLRQPPRF